MLWIKAFHIIFMVTWFAGLFYLPRLFVYHSTAYDSTSTKRFKVMERRLYYGITTPGGVLTIVSGLWLWMSHGVSGGWLYSKLALVLLLVVYHAWCGRIVRDFRREQNVRTETFFRWFNEFPVVILISVVLLSTLKPF